MKISLSDHFTYKKLFKFTLPSILMMIFTSIYGVVDGFFVSNYVGESAFVAVNLIMPFLMILATVGFMFGTGGSALVSKTMGEGKDDKARRIFSLLVYFSAGVGVILAVIAFIFMRHIASLIGAEGQTLDYCVSYARIIVCALPFFVMQMEFQSFTIVAEKPGLGFAITVSAGVANMILDALLMGAFNMGIVGAALATAVSQMIGGLAPFIYYLRKNTSRLKLGKPEWNGKALIRTCTNGASEFVGNISMSMVSMLYNFQLLRYAGESGVAAYGALMYVNMIFIAIFAGYTVGTSPIISYHYGAGNTAELKNLFRKGFVVMIVVGTSMTVLALTLSSFLSSLFMGYDADMMRFTRRAIMIYSFSFPFCGIAFLGSGFFTALNNGFVSAAISFLRTLVFQIASVMLLPIIFDIDGIWASMVVTEFMACTLSIIFFIAKRRQYNYF